MSNALKIDLTGQVVIFKQEALRVPANEHPYLVEGGFGADPHTRGSTIYGHFLSDGERAPMDGWDVERLATEEEVAGR